MGEAMARSGWKKTDLIDIVRDRGEPPPKLVVVEPPLEVRALNDHQLRETIEKTKATVRFVGRNLPDNGRKLRARLGTLEAEEARRKALQENDVAQGEEEPTSLDEQRKCRQVSPGTSSPGKFFSLFNKKLETDNMHTLAFSKELGLCHGNYKSSRQSRISDYQRRKSCLLLRPYSKGKPVIWEGLKPINQYYVDHQVHSFSSPRSMERPREQQNHVSQHLTEACRNRQDVILLDEEDITAIHSEEDDEENRMSNVKIYYPTREHADCVVIDYSDITCLDPESYLSSTIMNFYIQYLQKPILPMGRPKGEYYIFNTYFYSKLVESSSSKSDNRSQLLKLRRWFKGINLFQKAYIFLPVHDSLHWSLVIICIPVMEDESGPILLHLDSLGLHDSNVIFQIIERYLKIEWEHMIETYGSSPPNLPISAQTWKDLPKKIVKRRSKVPQQENGYDCGLFVLYFIERFIMEAPERARSEDLQMFGQTWFRAEEASGLRKRLRELLMEEFENARLNNNAEEFSPSTSSSSGVD